MDEKNLTHLNDAGEVRMVDVGDKPVTRRTAVAEGVVAMPADLVTRFFAGDLPKGDAPALVRVAGIMGAKKTPDLIPLCHPIAIDSVEIALTPGGHGVLITATVSTTGQTGVEMEAMTAVATAALTVYDMVKGVERGVTIESVRLRKKEGGRTGTWERSEISTEIID
jgi:cyclic pyranopterin phosphate synthase